MTTCGERIKLMRAENKLKQKELAVALGIVSPPYKTTKTTFVFRRWKNKLLYLNFSTSLSNTCAARPTTAAMALKFTRIETLPLPAWIWIRR